MSSSSSFLDKLSQLRANFCDDVPTPELAVLTRTVTRLRRAGTVDECLQHGETVPDFEFIGQDGSPRRLYQVLEDGPAVLNFFRGFWCPYCRTEIEAYEQIQSTLEALGCSYFAISPQKPETAEQLPANYQVIFDRNNRIARQFGIVFQLNDDEIALFRSWGLKLEDVNDTTEWALPIPATFVVGRDRRIAYEFVDVDYRQRCCPDQLIDELRGMAS